MSMKVSPENDTQTPELEKRQHTTFSFHHSSINGDAMPTSAQLVQQAQSKSIWCVLVWQDVNWKRSTQVLAVLLLLSIIVIVTLSVLLSKNGCDETDMDSQPCLSTTHPEMTSATSTVSSSMTSEAPPNCDCPQYSGKLQFCKS